MTLRLQMFAVPLALGAMLLAGPVHAGGAAGVNMAWDDCGTAGVADKAVANCTASNTGLNTFYASFIAPAGITALNSAEIYINLVTASPALEAWWDIGVAPACRAANSLQMNYITPCGSATDYWGSIPTAGGSSVYTKNPPAAPNQVPGANHEASEASSRSMRPRPVPGSGHRGLPVHRDAA